MGNDVSHGKHWKNAQRYGQIFTMTDKPSYIAGETVTGKVYLNLLAPYPGNQLYVKLKGKEFVHFAEEQSRQGPDGQMERYHIHRKEKIKLIDYKFPVYQWGSLMPGQFVFPFQFVLPSNLPATFFQQGHKYLADISYYLEGLLEPTLLSEPKLKQKQRFVVREPIKGPVQQVSGEKRSDLTACCSSKGSNLLQATFERNCYRPGEVAQVCFFLDNSQSQIDCTNISFSLTQKLHLKVGGHSFNRSFTVASRQLEGVKAGGASDRNFTSLNLPPFQEGDLWVIKQGNMEDYIMGNQGSNNTINATTSSKNVTSQYLLDVRANMDGCCATCPDINVELSIVCPDFNTQQPPQPQNWAPQVMDQCNLSLSSQYQVSVPGISVNMGGNNMGMNVNMNMGGNISTQETVTIQEGGHHHHHHHHNNEKVEIKENFGAFGGPSIEVDIKEGGGHHHHHGHHHHNETVEVKENFNFGGANIEVDVKEQGGHHHHHHHHHG